MRAIPPNRKFTTSLTSALRSAAMAATMIGTASQGWCDNVLVPASAAVPKSAAPPRASSLHFVTPVSESVLVKVHAAPQPAEPAAAAALEPTPTEPTRNEPTPAEPATPAVAAKPVAAAPLSVSDYQSYFRWVAPLAAAIQPVASPKTSQPTAAVERAPKVAVASKPLDPIAAATPLEKSEPAEQSDSQVPKIALAPSAAPVRKDKKSSDTASTIKSHSLIVSAPVDESSKIPEPTEAPGVSEPTPAEAETRVAERPAKPLQEVAKAPAAVLEPIAAPASEPAVISEPAPAATENRVAERPATPIEEVAKTPAATPAPAVEPAPAPAVTSEAAQTEPETRVAEQPAKPVKEVAQAPVAPVAPPVPVAVPAPVTAPPAVNETMPAPQPPVVGKALEVPEYPASMSVDAVHPPLTTSSFLPANPESYCYRCGVQCPPCGCNPGGPGWWASRPIPWEVFAQGEYIGPARLAHVPVYRLRVDDRISFVFRLSGQVAGKPYRINVRDRIQIKSLSAPETVDREAIVQPDGTVTLPYLGQVRVAGTTIEDLSKQLDDLYLKYMKDPRISVTPLVLNSNLEELRMSVDRRYGSGGLGTDARVSPDGTVQLPAIGAVPAQGLTLDELEREVKTRYAMIVEGLEVTPILLDRAPRFLYVVGEVRVPGRFEMTGPTTVMQAIALAGSWNVGAQLEHVVIFRRDENWRLMATKVDVRSSLLFKKPCPGGEIWLRDSDIVLVPKSPILCADDVINLVFTRGIYGVFPMSAQLNFSKLSSL